MTMSSTGCSVHKIARALVVIGGINWGLIAVGGFLGQNLNVVNLVLGSLPTVELIVYLLVGISAIVLLFGCKCKTCRTCHSCGTDAGTNGNGGMGAQM